MKWEEIRVAKQHRPLHAEAVLDELRNSFPDYQLIPGGRPDNQWIVKQSSFIGARIDVTEKKIRLAGKMPTPAARFLNVLTLGTLSAATSPAMLQRLKRHLRQRYG